MSLFRKIVTSFVKSLLKNWFTKLNYIICLGLCLYQIYTISQLYFAYKTTTIVNYANSSLISLPAITICFNKYEVLRNKTFNNVNNNNDLGKSFENITIKDQFDQLYDYDDIISGCIVTITIDLAKTKHNHFSHASCLRS